ncbi:unnamed protein product, partial [Symbiodinium sp. CCMP2456]
SELGYALEFQLMGPGGCVEPDEEMSPGSSRPSSDTPLCSCNRILQERHFMKGLPSCDQMWAARETRSVTGSEIPAQLAANSLIGLLPPPGGHLRLRPVGAEEWAPELPLSDSPQALPFTTLLSFPEDAGISDTVLCVCHDLFGVPEEDARGGYPEGALQPPGSIGSAPQVLCLRPLLRFSHCCPGRMKLTALPLGTALADSGERQAVQSKGGDPRSSLTATSPRKQVHSARGRCFWAVSCSFLSMRRTRWFPGGTPFAAAVGRPSSTYWWSSGAAGCRACFAMSLRSPCGGCKTKPARTSFSVWLQALGQNARVGFIPSRCTERPRVKLGRRH